MNLAKLRALRERLQAEREHAPPEPEPELTLKEQIMRKAAVAYGGGPDQGDVGLLEPRDLEGRFWTKYNRTRS